MKRIGQSKLFSPMNAYLKEKQAMGLIHIINFSDHTRPDDQIVPEHITASVVGHYASVVGHYATLRDVVVPEMQLIVKESALSAFGLTTNYFYLIGWGSVSSMDAWAATLKTPTFTERLTCALILWDDVEVIAQMWTGDTPELSNKFKYMRLGYN